MFVGPISTPIAPIYEQFIGPIYTLPTGPIYIALIAPIYSVSVGPICVFSVAPIYTLPIYRIIKQILPAEALHMNLPQHVATKYYCFVHCISVKIILLSYI